MCVPRNANTFRTWNFYALDGEGRWCYEMRRRHRSRLSQIFFSTLRPVD